VIVIGLTGGIASGKTTVSGMLMQLGAVVLDADEIGHEVIKPHTRVWQRLIDNFGKEILLPSGEVDRQRLGEMVFGDSSALKKLNQIMHPPMYRIVEEKLNDLSEQGVGVVVLEAALLFEAGWTPLVDRIWVTNAPETTVLRRLKSEKGLTEAQALARLNAQLPPEEKIKRADALIDTDCDLNDVKARVKVLWRELNHQG
jgi:dephospho-CoA kinase